MARSIPLEELSKHQSPQDLWTAVRGKVYNVTKFLDDHPGGADALKSVAGVDGTESFNYAGHSENAVKTLQQFEIGTLGVVNGGILVGRSGTMLPQAVRRDLGAPKANVVNVLVVPAALFLALAGGYWVVFILYPPNGLVDNVCLLHPGVLFLSVLGMATTVRLYFHFGQTLKHHRDLWEYPSYFPHPSKAKPGVV